MQAGMRETRNLIACSSNEHRRLQLCRRGKRRSNLTAKQDGRHYLGTESLQAGLRGHAHLQPSGTTEYRRLHLGRRGKRRSNLTAKQDTGTISGLHLCRRVSVNTHTDSQAGRPSIGECPHRPAFWRSETKHLKLRLNSEHFVPNGGID